MGNGSANLIRTAVLLILFLICRRHENAVAEGALALPRKSKTGFDLTRWNEETVKAAADLLSEQSRSVLLEGGTEVSYTGRFISGER
jgi:hypothetical protein